jgi:putative ABC transport system permease protein
MTMLKHIFKSTFKNAFNGSVLSVTKLFGISLSFAVILLVASYVRYETSFDNFFKEKDRIFRVYMKGALKGRDFNAAVTSAPMARGAKKEIPEIADATTIKPQGGRVYTVDLKDFIFEDGLMLADTNFFSFFNLEIISTTLDPLNAKNNIVLSESLARKLFSSGNLALNKAVKLKNGDKYDDFIVTGIFKDIPDNCHFKCTAVANISNLNDFNDVWGGQNFNTFIKTSSSVVNRKLLDFKLSQLVFLHSPQYGKDAKNARSFEDLKLADDTYLYFLTEKLTDIHFSKHKFDYAATTNITYVYGAITLALLVLLISAFNYVNLTITNFKVRAKEFGIRKTNGAGTKDVILHFFSESLLFWTICFLISLFIYYLSKEYIDNYLGFDTRLNASETIKVVSICFVGLILFNLLINALPVIVYSKNNVISLSNIGKSSSSKKGFSRNSILLVQFFISAVVILCTLIVHKQIKYTNTKYLGYDYKNVLVLDHGGIPDNKSKALIDEIKNNVNISSISVCSCYFGGQDPAMNAYFFETVADENFFHASHIEVSAEFIKTLNIQLSQGRFFEKDRKADEMAVVLNETAAKEYTKNESLLGKYLIIGGDPTKYQIIGILKDFNFRSIHNPIEPLVIFNREIYNYSYIKVNNNQIAEAKMAIQSAFKELSISRSPDYSFLDEVLARSYVKDKKAMKLLLLISIISILISCFGLYAIVYFNLSRKVKEIGIRKINGAKVTEVMTMINKDFLRWIFIAFILACPVAWYLMQKWLQNFAYKTELSWWVFALAGLLTLGIALMTMSWQTWRAATRNPVEALRYE